MVSAAPLMLQAKAQQSSKDAGKSAAKNAQAAKKTGTGKTKTKKKTWTKVKIKDKLNNDVFLDEKRWTKIASEIPKILCITRATVMDKFKVNGSIARAIIKRLAQEGTIKLVGDHSASFDLYTGV